MELATIFIVAATGTCFFRSIPEIRPHTLAASTSLVLYAVRVHWIEDNRLGIFLTVLWPGIGLMLAYVVLRRPACLEAALVAITALGLFASWGAVIAHWGYFLAWAWPWPLLGPQLIAALGALELWQQRKTPANHKATWAQFGAIVLPASTMADLLTTWAGAPDDVRVVLGCVTWCTMGAIMAACRTARVGG